MKRILIAGVPATGKTTIGQYLEKKYNFRHFDVEGEEANPSVSRIGKLFWDLNIDRFLEHVEEDGRNTVITWGFVCDNQRSLTIINMLQKRRFKFVWFQAKEHMAREAFLNRGTGNIYDFDCQMERIRKLDLSIFNSPIIITTLDKNGRKDKNEIIEEIIKVE
jgi:adenylate kinase family enzyme